MKRADDSKVHYERVPLQAEIIKRMAEHARRVIPNGSYHVPLAAVAALGGDDIEVGEHVLQRMFKMAAPRAAHPHALRELGNGSITAGRKVLQKFLDRAGTIIEQPDGNHGRVRYK
jgi:hypothetical protein